MLLINLNFQPFVIEMESFFETSSEVYIVLEYMEGGELGNRISAKRPLPESEVKFLFWQILMGISYLHTNNITHRDLKVQ